MRFHVLEERFQQLLEKPAKAVKDATTCRYNRSDLQNNQISLVCLRKGIKPLSNRLSGTLAIICIDKFERNHIYNEVEPKIYVRYVDDIGTVVKTVSQAHSFDFDSHHSSATKIAVVHNELRRANICSTTEHQH